MCGIAGWFDVQPLANGVSTHASTGHHAQAQLQGMIDAIAHRGPDGRGALLTDHAALGHARLSIIDIDGGAQPMADVDNRAVIIFNGEIYNYRALRDQLRARGQRFATESDTETVLALDLHHGIAGLSRLRGMYALAIWDRRHQRGLLARDPLGIKPLFIHQRADQLYFGSEAKALLGGGIDATLDEASLHLLLNFRYLSGERSLFRGIRQLSPGTALCWTADGRITETRIKRPMPSEGITPAQSPQRLQEQVVAALGESVQAHLVSDVQVGAYLSGGIDSAAVVALARANNASTIPTFTLDVGDDPAEAANAARSAALLQVDNRLATDTRPPAAMLPDLIRQLEVPKVNAWQVAELARHAARDVKVVLSGLGGDELFYGYNMHSIMARTESIGRLPGAARRADSWPRCCGSPQPHGPSRNAWP